MGWVYLRGGVTLLVAVASVASVVAVAAETPGAESRLHTVSAAGGSRLPSGALHEPTVAQDEPEFAFDGSGEATDHIASERITSSTTAASSAT